LIHVILDFIINEIYYLFFTYFTLCLMISRVLML